MCNFRSKFSGRGTGPFLEILDPALHTEEGSILYLYNKFEADSSVRSKIIIGPKIWKLGHVTRPRTLSFNGPCAGKVRPLSVYQT